MNSFTRRLFVAYCILSGCFATSGFCKQHKAPQEEKSFYTADDIQQQLAGNQFEEPVAEAVKRLQELGARFNGYESKGVWWIQLDGPTRFVSWSRVNGPVIEEIEAVWKGNSEDLLLLNKFPSVRLTLEYFPVDKELIDSMGKLTTLNKLKIGGGTLESHHELFSALATCENLVAFDLNTFYQTVTEDIFNSITSIVTLERLTVYSSVAMEEGSLANLDRLKKLKKLSLPGVDFELCPVEKFHELVNLEELSLNGCRSIGRLIKGAKAFERLTKIDLTGCEIKKLDFQMLTKALPNLQSIRLCRPKVEPDVIGQIVDYLISGKRLVELNHFHIDQQSTTHQQLARLKCSRPDLEIEMMVVRGGMSMNWPFGLNKTESDLLKSHQASLPGEILDLQKHQSDSELFSERVLLDDQLSWMQAKLESGSAFEIEPLIEPLIAHEDLRAIPALIQLLEIAELVEDQPLQLKLKTRIGEAIQNQDSSTAITMRVLERGNEERSVKDLPKEFFAESDFGELTQWWNGEMQKRAFSHAGRIEIESNSNFVPGNWER